MHIGFGFMIDALGAIARDVVAPVLTYLPTLSVAPAGAWGSSRQIAAYAGPALRARRVSDNAEADIGFAGQGLDMAAASAFAGASTLFVTTLYDQTGQGRHLTQPTLANQPDLYLGSGTPEMIFSGNQAMMVPAGVSFDRANHAMLFVGRDFSVASSSTFFIAGAGPDLHYYAPTGGAAAMGVQGSASYSFAPEYQTVMPLERAIASLVSRPAGMIAGRGEALSSVGAAQASLTIAGGTIGGDQSLSTTGLMIDALLIYPAAPSDAELVTLRTALRTIHTTRTALTSIIQYKGDSITNGVGAIKGYSLPRVTADLIADRGFLSYKSGVNGAVIAATQSATWNVPGAARKLLHIWYGTNNIAANGDSGATVLGYLEAMADRARANGFDKIIVGTMLPRSGLSAQQLADRTTLNSGLRASAKFDAVADYAQESHFAAAGAETNTALLPDGIHPSMLGYNYLKLVTKAAIDAVLAQPLTLTIAGTPAGGTQGAAYAGFAPTVTGGTAPFGFSVPSGALPAGLSLNAATGAITGTPTGTGTATFTLRVTDSQAPARTADLAASIAVGAAFAYLLDAMAAVPTRAFSTRKLRAGYPGAAMLVQRSSDSAQLAIGFVNNELDTAALTAFVGAGTGYVMTWYDQSGNGQDFTAAAIGTAPVLVTAGALTTINGKASVKFGGGQKLSGPLTGAPAQRTVLGVIDHTSAGGGGTILGATATNSYVLDISASHQLAIKKYPGSTVLAASTVAGVLNTLSTFHAVYDGLGLAYAFAVDGAGETGAITATVGGAATTSVIGSVVSSFSGQIPELIVFDGALVSAGDFTAARANRQGYWGTA